MKVQGHYLLPGTTQQVWELLNDSEAMAKCLPGCEHLEPDGPDHYRAKINVVLAAISGKYTATLELSEKKPPSSLRMRVTGKGAPGFMNGEGRLELVEANGQTDVRYDGEAQVGGMIAAVGARMIEAVAKKLLAQFFASVAAFIEEKKRQMITDLRYPIGEFRFQGQMTENDRREAIATIAEAPARLRAAVKELSPEQLDTPYRPGGWTVRQVVHHVPDSHLNAYVRFKLALTEQHPTIKPYNEARWAELADTAHTPIETSLALLDALHERWVTLLRSLGPADFSKTLQHPERGLMTLDEMLAHYAWHSRHHVAHITSLRERMGWNQARQSAN